MGPPFQIVMPIILSFGRHYSLRFKNLRKPIYHFKDDRLITWCQMTIGMPQLTYTKLRKATESTNDLMSNVVLGDLYSNFNSIQSKRRCKIKIIVCIPSKSCTCKICCYHVQAIPLTCEEAWDSYNTPHLKSTQSSLT